MNPVVTDIILYTFLAGLAIPVGGFIARIPHLVPDWLEDEFRHFVIALGGGIMLGAVAIVLVPVGMSYMNYSGLAIVAMLAGGISFFLLERFLGLKRQEAPQFTGMLLDYIPECLALGGIAALGASSAPLLAILIGMQNLPEGFNAYRELANDQQQNQRTVLLQMTGVVFIGPLFGVLGYWLLPDIPALLGHVLIFAAGGILYLIFQDIAPQAKLQKHWAPPLGAVVGFVLAMTGQLITGHS